MSSAPFTIKQTCTCGHDIDTHYALPEGGRGGCLGMRCDDCHSYHDALSKRPRAPPAPPSIPVPLDSAPATDPSPPLTHYGPWGFPNHYPYP